MRRGSTTAGLATVTAIAAAVVALAGTGGPPSRATADWVVGAPVERRAPIAVTEREGGVRITVRHRPGAPERLWWRTAPRTAKAGEDFEAASGLLQFRPGDRERTIEVDVRADGVPEGEERLDVVLSALPGLPEARGGAVATVALTDG